MRAQGDGTQCEAGTEKGMKTKTIFAQKIIQDVLLILFCIKYSLFALAFSCSYFSGSA